MSLEPFETAEPALARFALKPAFQRAANAVAAIAKRGFDVLLPPQCLSCRTLVDQPGLLCAKCFSGAQAIAPPFCRSCGVPLPSASGISGLAHVDLSCGRCLTEPPVFTRARSVFVYDDVARRLVHDLKYGDRLEGRASFGAWLARAGGDCATQADFIIPVPLHYIRLVRRRYNQAVVLAKALSQSTRRPLAVDALRRVRPTKSQTGLSADARASNMRGAFQVRKNWVGRIKGAQIVLVDDVMTTGATVNACARALKRAGAADITVLTLARVKEPM
ncbi:MAG: ComF family protein [Alphaproteobacteria bacterium]